jgi:hypothetical protein
MISKHVRVQFHHVPPGEAAPPEPLPAAATLRPISRRLRSVFVFRAPPERFPGVPGNAHFGCFGARAALACRVRARPAPRGAKVPPRVHPIASAAVRGADALPHRERISMDSRPPAHATPIPGGIADAQGNVGYVVAAGGGIDAVDLRSGGTLWHTDEASRPLAAAQGQMAAARVVPDAPNRIQTVVLDAARGGKPVSTSASIDLPSWVDAESDHADDLALDAELGEGRLVLRWEAHGRYRGGASPPADVEAREQGDAAGTAEVDLRTGAVRTEASASAGPPPSNPAADAFAPPPDEAPIAYQVGTSWKTGPWTAAESLAALRPGPEGGVLLNTQGPADDAPVESRISDDADADVRVTLDGGYVLVRGAAGANPGAAGGEPWEVVPVRQPGERRTLTLRAGAHNFSVAGGRLIYVAEEPGLGVVRRLLAAHDLGSGGHLWTRELGARADAGPPPLPQAPPPPA